MDILKTSKVSQNMEWYSTLHPQVLLKSMDVSKKSKRPNPPIQKDEVQRGGAANTDF